MVVIFALGGFGFGLVVAGGLIDDGLIRPSTIYWEGFALVIAVTVAGLWLFGRHLASLRGKQPD